MWRDRERRKLDPGLFIFSVRTGGYLAVPMALRSALRTIGPRQLGEMLVSCVAYAAVGFSFGAIATAAGLPLWVPIVFSAVVFAGGAQFAALSVLLAGGSYFAATATALVLNARMLPFGLALSDVFSGSIVRLLFGAHLVVDGNAAMAMQEVDPVRRRAIFWVYGGLIYLTWNVSTVAGALVGKAVGSIDPLGLDAALPLVLLAPIVPALREKRARRAALSGAALAIVATPFLPVGYPILLSLLGLTLRGRTRSASAVGKS
jgi:4-azaleucine resistance transporter AzlC